MAQANTFGKILSITTFGESHGGGVGVILDGCPPRLPISIEEVQVELDRRRPGQSRLTTPRNESDQVEILSGVHDGLTLGTPIAMLVRNKDARPSSYREMEEIYRPSHADYTYDAKFGIRAVHGGGRASARETIGRVAAGAIARKLLQALTGAEVVGWVQSVHNVTGEIDPGTVTRQAVEADPTRCPDPAAAATMYQVIDQARRDQDSVGGVVQCVLRGLPPGLGEPVFDRMEADLARAMMSLPASKGFEIGSGFAGTRMRGSEHNDPYVPGPDGSPRTSSNRSGGVQGGITNGEDVVFRVAFKPTATISQPQNTVNRRNEAVTLAARGRHDPCVLPRAVPMVEAMACLVAADHLLRQIATAVRPAAGWPHLDND